MSDHRTHQTAVDGHHWPTMLPVGDLTLAAVPDWISEATAVPAAIFWAGQRQRSVRCCCIGPASAHAPLCSPVAGSDTMDIMRDVPLPEGQSGRFREGAERAGDIVASGWTDRDTVTFQDEMGQRGTDHLPLQAPGASSC